MKVLDNGDNNTNYEKLTFEKSMNFGTHRRCTEY